MATTKQQKKNMARDITSTDRKKVKDTLRGIGDLVNKTLEGLDSPGPSLGLTTQYYGKCSVV